MKSSEHPRRIWTLDRVRAIANKCKNHKEFYTEYPRAYQAAVRDGWLEKLDLPRARETWSFEALSRITSKYDTRLAFSRGKPAAYSAAKNHGWLDELFGGHPNKGYSIKPRGYWNFERVADAASKFKYRNDFQLNSRSAYSVAQRNGWLNDVCAHMERIGNVNERAIYSIRNTEDKIIYIGLSQNPRQRYQQHRDRGKKSVRNLIHGEHEFRIHTKCLPKDEAIVREDSMIKWYKQRYWNILNSYRGGALGGNIIKWSWGVVIDVAKQYESRAEFAKQNNGAYQTALKNGWLDLAFENHSNEGFTTEREKHGYWTFDRCMNLANRCKYRTEFSKKHKSAYSIASKNDWINKLFKDHANNGFKKSKKRGSSFEYCQELADKSENRGRFQAEYRYAYDRARNQGWLDELFAHHEYLGFTSYGRMVRYCRKVREK